MYNPIIKFNLNYRKECSNNTRCLEFCIDQIDIDFSKWIINKSVKQIYLFDFSSKKIRLVNSWSDCFIDENRLAMYFMNSGSYNIQSYKGNKIMYLNILPKNINQLYFDSNSPSTTTIEEFKIYKRNILKAIILLKNLYIKQMNNVVS